MANVDVDIQRVTLMLSIWAYDKGAVITAAISQILRLEESTGPAAFLLWNKKDVEKYQKLLQCNQ